MMELIDCCEKIAAAGLYVSVESFSIVKKTCIL